MKIEITKSEVNDLLETSNASAKETRGLSGFRIAYLYDVGAVGVPDYIVSIDETTMYLFDNAYEAVNYFNGLK